MFRLIINNIADAIYSFIKLMGMTMCFITPPMCVLVPAYWMFEKIWKYFQGDKPTDGKGGVEDTIRKLTGF